MAGGHKKRRRVRVPEGFGGYTATARHLSEISGREVTRQQVYAWHLRRVTSHFPGIRTVACDGGIKRLFKLSEAEAWLARYWELGEPYDPGVIPAWDLASGASDEEKSVYKAGPVS